MIKFVCERKVIFMKIKKEQPICPKCNGKNIMARIKTDELYCRRCGYVGKREEFFKGEIKDIKI